MHERPGIADDPGLFSSDRPKGYFLRQLFFSTSMQPRGDRVYF